MPGRAYRICAKSGCNKLSVGKYCELHLEYQKQADAERSTDPIRSLLGTATWQATRKIILLRDVICKACGKAFSNEVDHIIPARRWVADHAGDMASFFDESNLQGLCKPCHTAKTDRERGNGMARKFYKAAWGGGVKNPSVSLMKTRPASIHSRGHGH
jgi:5-methylcytosine-specific restriction enzyme A